MLTERHQILEFFEREPRALPLFEAAQTRIEAAFPGAALRIQKTQINFDDPHMFVCCSLPLRRMKGWPEVCVILTFVLPYEVKHERIAVCSPVRVERFTHHVLLTEARGVDAQIIEWLREAHGLMRVMRHRKQR